MVHSHVNHDRLQSLKDAHEDIRAPIEQLRKVVRERSEGSAVADALVLLRDELTRHFELEEAEGYLDDAVAQTPVLMRRACDLLQQHGAIQKRLEDLIVCAQEAVPTEAWWNDFCGQVDQFVLTLLDHETSEHQLLNDTFDWDV